MAWDELGRRETERYLNDMDALNVRRPNVYARATAEIPAMIEIISTLLAPGYAYESSGSDLWHHESGIEARSRREGRR